MHRHRPWYRLLVALLVLLTGLLAPSRAGGMSSEGPPPSAAPVPLLGGAVPGFRGSSSPRLDPSRARSAGRVAATPQLPGDFNGDGVVDLLDYGVWRQNYGATNCGNPADADGNCLVDVRDYGVWGQHFGQTLGTATPTATATSTPTSTTTPTKDRMYVANNNGTTVSQVLNVGGTPTIVPGWATGFSAPAGLALDAANQRLYVVNISTNAVSQVLNVGGTPTVVPGWAVGFSNCHTIT